MDYNINFIDKAERAIKESITVDRYGNDKLEITTSQLRKFLSAVNVLRNKVDVYVCITKNGEMLSDELAGEVKFLKVTLAYMSGRESKVKTFVNKTELTEFIDGIGKSTKKFYLLCKYIEALVAYHKFYGGRDK